MRKLLLITLSILLLTACGKNVSDTPNPNPVTTPTDPNAPLAATLTFPEQNAVCTTGTVINGTQSSVTFSWKAGANTTSYDLVLKNLLTASATSQSTPNTNLTITLNRNTPYSWYLVSKSTNSTTTATSDTWKFYNSGPGVTTYAPFPADLTLPSYGQSVNAGTVNLTWAGSTPPLFTIANYDIYFGTSTIPSLYKANLTDSFLNTVPVTTKTTYYWKVVTRDTNGNTSYSQVSQFTVN